jgi:peroxiredoxin
MTELGELRKRYREIMDRGVEIVAVSVDPPAITEKLRKKLDLPIRFLCDVNGTLMDPLHIRHDGGMPPAMVAGEVAKINPSKDLFLATNFLLDEQGVIRWIYRPDTYRMRASIDELIAAIDRRDC